MPKIVDSLDVSRGWTQLHNRLFQIDQAQNGTVQHREGVQNTTYHVTVGLPRDIKGVPTNDQKKLRGWCKYEVSWGSMCRNLGMCFTEIIMLSLHIFFIEV